MLNGSRIELTEEEEKAIKSEWESNRVKREQKIKERQDLKLARERIVDKLLSGLTEDEKLLIKGKLI